MKTFDEVRGEIGDFLRNSPDSHKLWDLMTGLRGPDSPSERPNMSSSEHSIAYNGRRKRKYKTVEVIRHHAFNGVVGGSARSHNDDKVILPVEEKRDHFDRHVEKAAAVLGLKVEVESEGEGVKVEVKGKISTDATPTPAGTGMSTFLNFASLSHAWAAYYNEQVNMGNQPGVKDYHYFTQKWKETHPSGTITAFNPTTF